MGIKVDRETMEQILGTPGVIVGPSAQLPASPAHPRISEDTPKGKAKGKRRAGEKNQVEQAYEDFVLRPRLGSQAIIGYWFEPISLIIGKRCSYTPDYMVWLADLTIEFHEVKIVWRGGRVGWHEDARIKWKAAADKYPLFSFVAVAGDKTKNGWTWSEERL